MSSESNAGNVALIASSGGGAIVAINNWATIISLSLTAIGIITGIIFHVLAYKHRQKETLRHSAKERAELKEELLNELRAERDKA